MTLKEATSEHFKDWSLMRHRLWPQSSIEEHRRELEAEAEVENPRFKAWIAQDWDKAIGFAEASLRPYANGCDSRPVVFLEGIWIDPDYRKQGFGRAFVDAVESWARSQEIFEIGSDAALDNLDSQRTHGRWGFEETERVVYFRKKLT